MTPTILRYCCISFMLTLGGCGYFKMPPAIHGGKLPVVKEWDEAYGERYAEFRQGYADGCETGFSAYSLPFYKSFNTWKQDWRLANGMGHGTYYKSWKDAYRHCAAFALGFGQHGWGNHR